MLNLLECVHREMRLRHMSRRTEESYTYWIHRFLRFHNRRPPHEMGEEEIRSFLSSLAVDGHLAVATQHLALNSILFLYRSVLSIPLASTETLAPTRRTRRLPVVFTQVEVAAILERLEGAQRLMGSLLYGSGLRLAECLQLRVRDVDFASGMLSVHGSKESRARRTMLPAGVAEPLRAHLAQVRALHRSDCADGYGAVLLPATRMPEQVGTTREWGWQYCFPSSRLAHDRRSGTFHRHHLDPSALQRAIRQAVERAGIKKAGGAHSLRHSFAIHLLESGQTIHTVQELLGHADVRTTMLYTHLMNGAVAARSPLDALAWSQNA